MTTRLGEGGSVDIIGGEAGKRSVVYTCGLYRPLMTYANPRDRCPLNETPRWPNLVNPDGDADLPRDFIDVEPSSSACVWGWNSYKGRSL
jgi:hypothetical protein